MIANIIIVWITKYRKAVLSGLVGSRVGELLRQICKEHDLKILKGYVSKDHIDMFLSVPPHLAISKLVQLLPEKIPPVNCCNSSLTLTNKSVIMIMLPA